MRNEQVRTSDSTVFLIGSSRSDGNTWHFLEHINTEFNYRVIDVSARSISYFDYEYQNIDDDFIPTIGELLAYSTIGFVSPVYWYTVSAQLKTFIDRFSDLLVKRKDLGRALAGKQTFLLATGGTDDVLPQGMEDCIKLTSEYMDMTFAGSFYAKACGEKRFATDDLERGIGFVRGLSSISE